MNDSWCKKVRAKSGSVVSGGAARNVRIAARGGMDEIIADAIRYAFERAEGEVSNRRKRTALRLVA